MGTAGLRWMCLGCTGTPADAPAAVQIAESIAAGTLFEELQHHADHRFLELDFGSS